MKKIIQPISQPINSHVFINGSKSMSNRALLLAALARGESLIRNIQLGDDTLAFIQALRELGINIFLDKETLSCKVWGSGGKFTHTQAKIGCQDAGTLARFLLAAVANTKGTYHFDANPRLRQRPLQELIKILSQQGMIFSPIHAEQMPFSMHCPHALQGGRITLDNSLTSQSLSALLMAAPLAQNTFHIISNDLISKPYVDMTIAMMKEFGIECRQEENHYTIPLGHYQARDYYVEPDLSTASYFFAAAAITQGKVTIPHLNRNTSKQADAAFLSVLEKMGCQVIEQANSITVIGCHNLQGININMQDFSDTFMTLAAIAAFAKTPTYITGIQHTRLKESDRIAAMASELAKLNIKTETAIDSMCIFPSIPKAALIDSHQDHRIAMSCALVGLKTAGVVINGAEAVNKTCPDFFDKWQKLAS